MEKKNKYVKLTKKILKQYFDECNEKYFNSQVEEPMCFETWTPSKKIVGWARGVWDNKTKTWHSALHVSRNFNWTEKNLIDTIVHEMIHLESKDYLEKVSWWRRLFQKDHNENFFKRMEELNTQYPELNIVLRAKHMKKEKKRK